jgi:hypothetical protein
MEAMKHEQLRVQIVGQIPTVDPDRQNGKAVVVATDGKQRAEIFLIAKEP